MNNTELNIVVDENIPYAEQMFSMYGKVTKVNGRTLTAQQLQGVDVLLVRSVTNVSAALLEGSSVKFVGSATIGTDHIDLEHLARHNIAFSSAPGCNANAVVEYDLCCLYELLAQSGEDLCDKTVAVIGVGNVGQRLAAKLQVLGVKKVLLNDPPRAESESGFDDLDYVFKHADIIAVHTPLVKTGAHCTHHLISAAQLSQLKPNAILLNAGRGPAIKADDLLVFMQKRADVRVVLDVWEHEPVVNSQLAELVSIATPHIAGYSLEGRVRGTYMLKEAFSKLLGEKLNCQFEDYLPLPAVASMQLNSDFDPLAIVKLIYDPFKDDRALRASLNQSNQAEQFDLLRKHYPMRREFKSLQLACTKPENIVDMHKLGFST
ncbi:MAG: 4-phosphoerythronate dehydrogenase [Oceanospirillaceae bacterium]|nr:4-phosphoerythronate dehydrogenase [Oceanospirillaceae bacterium]